MTQIVDKLYALRCNGVVDNPLFPQCEMRSAAIFNDPEAVSAAAAVAGWTESGGKNFCPAHSQAAAPAAKPSKPRAARAAAPQENQEMDGNS